MALILEFSHGPCLFHASLALMSSCCWFPCSLCHVLIGCRGHVYCSSQVDSSKVKSRIKFVLWITLYIKLHLPSV